MQGLIFLPTVIKTADGQKTDSWSGMRGLDILK